MYFLLFTSRTEPRSWNKIWIPKLDAGKGGDVDRLETLLAKALSAETKARAELIEEKNARVSDTAHLNAALDMARQRGSELQTRLAAVEQENVKLLQEREVRDTGLAFRLWSAMQDISAITEKPYNMA